MIEVVGDGVGRVGSMKAGRVGAGEEVCDPGEVGELSEFGVGW